MSESLPSIHEDRELMFAALATRRVEAELEILKIQERSGKATVKATIATDVRGFKTTLKDAMTRCGLGGTICRVARADSSGFDTEATFEGRREIVEDMKKVVKSKAGKGIEFSFKGANFGNFPNIVTVQSTGEGHRGGADGGDSSSGGVDAEFPFDDVSSLGSHGTSRGSNQGDFREAVLSRDDSRCLLCSSDSNVEAAHIYPVSATRTTRFDACGIRSKYDTRNGLSLCSQCHVLFDSGYWFPRVETAEGAKAYVAHISDALRHHLPSYSNFHLKNLSIDPNDKDSPDEALLTVQESYCGERREKRHRLSSPFQCERCHKFLASQTNLDTHNARVVKCKKPNFPPFTTPDKKGSTEGANEEGSDEDENLAVDEEEESMGADNMEGGQDEY